MAISNVGSNGNVYENVYSYQKKETDVSKQKSRTSEAKAETSKKSSNEEYLKELQKQVPFIKLQIGQGINTNNDGKVKIVDISPKLLEKMQNDPEAAKKYSQRLKDVESAIKFAVNSSKAMGHTVISMHSYIDENGKMSHFAYTIKKDELNERLREEAQENAQERIEKSRENSREKTEQLEEKLEEKAEKLLSEKLEKAKDGEIYLGDEDMRLIIEAVKEDKGNVTKVSSEAGANLDLKI